MDGFIASRDSGFEILDLASGLIGPWRRSTSSEKHVNQGFMSTLWGRPVNQVSHSNSATSFMSGRDSHTTENSTTESIKDLYYGSDRISTAEPADLFESNGHLWNQYKEYTFQQIQAATNNFSPGLNLGEQGYFVVYKGSLDSTTVTIKVPKEDGFECSQNFLHEVEISGHTHHPHIVRLLGACVEKGCLVYEYMENGRLDDCLLRQNNVHPLPWYSRFRIAAEIATTLHFLHNSRPEAIFHYDLKLGNILLNHNNVSKLARPIATAPIDVAVRDHEGKRPSEPFAHVDPEYQQTHHFGPKSDIYSLGIVMIQLLTASGSPLEARELVEMAVNSGTLNDVLDQSAGEWPLEKATQVASLALQCASLKQYQRPKLSAILSILDRVRLLVEELVATDTKLVERGNDLIPPIFLCPLRQEIMQQPVVVIDGYTYEHSAIKQWMEKHNTSPMTNLEFEHKEVIPNYSLQKLISKWESTTKLESYK